METVLIRSSLGWLIGKVTFVGEDRTIPALLQQTITLHNPVHMEILILPSQSNLGSPALISMTAFHVLPVKSLDMVLDPPYGGAVLTPEDPLFSLYESHISDFRKNSAKKRGSIGNA